MEVVAGEVLVENAIPSATSCKIVYFLEEVATFLERRHTHDD